MPVRSARPTATQSHSGALGLPVRRTVEVECGLADAGSYDDDVGWLCGGVALTVHSAFRHVYEVAGTRLHRVRAVRTKFHLECTGEDLDHRFVFAVMMPARHNSRLGTYESRPRSIGGEGLLSIHAWRRRAGFTLYRRHKQNQILFGSHRHSLLPRPRPMTLPGGGTPCLPATMVSLSAPWWYSPRNSRGRRRSLVTAAPLLNCNFFDLHGLITTASG